MKNGISADHIVEISFNDRRNKPLCSPDALLGYIDACIQKDKMTHFIILNEIQLVDDFVGILLSLMHNPQWNICFRLKFQISVEGCCY